MGVDLGDVPKCAAQLSELAGKKFAVDAYNAIYQFLSSVRQPDGTPLMDSEGRVTGHLAGIFYRNARLLEIGIRPIYVFDGTPPDFKRGELERRKERKLAAESAWATALEKGDTEGARKAAQATSRLTPEMAQEAKELLSHMGIPVVQAPSEGEAQATQLAIEGTADAVASQDMDCLLFGAPLLLRNLSVGGKRKIPGKNAYVEVEPEFIELESVLAGLGIDRRRLIWAGMLIGTDFDEGVKGIGPKKAMKIVKGCSSLQQAANLAGASGQLGLFEKVEDFFLNPPVEKGAQVRFGKPDAGKISDLLCRKHDFSVERVARACENVEKKMREVGAQTRLGSWQ